MLLILLTAAAYYYYHCQYFLLVSEMGEMPRLRRGIVCLSFIVNYLYFIVCSVLEFSLIFNWLFFAFLLFFETLIYNKGNKIGALFSTLLGIIFGLAINICCRSVMAISMNMPLQNFDNHTMDIGNLKGFPVMLGFILAGAAFHIVRKPVLAGRIRLILGHRQYLSFILEMMGGLFFYLFLNLLLYSTPLNDLLLKLWSIKSCLFCIIGLYIAIRYTWRICMLNDYREKNRQIQRQLEEQKREEERLRHQTFLDTLTGLYNRQYAEETLASMMENKAGFTLCFLDLDGLKNVNDQYGHEEGDRYIRRAAEEIRRACRSGVDSLYRYGGDEFLVLFVGVGAEAAEIRSEMINERLRITDSGSDYSYTQSLSYGVVESTDASDWKELIKAADRKMYEQKREKQVIRDSGEQTE